MSLSCLFHVSFMSSFFPLSYSAFLRHFTVFSASLGWSTLWWALILNLLLSSFLKKAETILEFHVVNSKKQAPYEVNHPLGSAHSDGKLSKFFLSAPTGLEPKLQAAEAASRVCSARVPSFRGELNAVLLSSLIWKYNPTQGSWLDFLPSLISTWTVSDS